MDVKTSRTSENKRTRLNEQQTNSVLNDTISVIENNIKQPVVNLRLKGVLNDVFGFIKAGGDFG